MTMGILNRLFGKSRSTASAAAKGDATVSLAGCLVQQGRSLAPGRCDECQATFISSESRIDILSAREPRFAIDVGGRCDRCGRQICPAHLKCVKVDAGKVAGSDKISGLDYGIVHRGCGGRIGARDRAIMIVSVTAEDLEAIRPKPAAKFAAASGKYSFYKLITAGGTGKVDMRELICARCFALHPHPSPATVFALGASDSYSPDDFEVDVGGDCPICGPICGKHAVPRLITMEGKKVIALHCATHGERLN
jgi:hypothetical protein